GVHGANYTNTHQRAFAYAEAGVNDAVAVLNGAYGLGTVAYPGDSSLLPMRTTTVPNGSVTWGGTLDQVTGKSWTWQWSVSSTATLANPTGPAPSPITSTVRIVVPVGLPLTTSIGSTSVLNWIYAGTDVTFTSSVAVGSPVYASRDLTLSNTSTIKGVAGTVVSGRNLFLGQPQNQIGLDGGG